MSERLQGVGVTPLSGLGEGFWYDPSPEPTADEHSDDPERERERFAAAQAAVDEALAAERRRVADEIGEEEAGVFEAHRQFLADPEIESEVEAAIDEGATAAAAVERGFGEGIERLAAMDGMMAERADDLRDVRDRLLRELQNAGEATDVPRGAVVLAERLTPSDTAGLDPDRIAGVATETGGRTSHAAIIARSVGLPAVVGVEAALQQFGGRALAVDGEAGAVIVDPDEGTREQSESASTTQVRTERVRTADGREIEVAANVGRKGEAAAAAEQGADGIGLFRSEFLFLDREQPPGEDEQVEAYREARAAFAPDDRVIVRTLDLGADKPVEYLDLDAEANGFLGARGIRLSLGAHAELFETQLRALLRAAAGEGASLSVMLPMVTTVDELDAARERLDAVAAELDTAGVGHGTPDIGVMIETPAAVEIAGELADRADFLSIGTNDLAGYTMAVRRDLDAVADYHDPLDPAVLRAVDRTVRAGHDADAWVGMCGEMAGEPSLVELLVGLGLDELSASPVAIPALKEQVAATDSEDARLLAEQALAAERREAVRELLDLP